MEVAKYRERKKDKRIRITKIDGTQQVTAHSQRFCPHTGKSIDPEVTFLTLEDIERHEEILQKEIAEKTDFLADLQALKADVKAALEAK